MRRGSFLSLVLLLLTTGFLLRSAAWLSPQANPHLNGVACDECHLRKPAAEEARSNLFTADIATLCLRCHKVRLGMSHPIAVKPSFKLPADMYLDWKGEMTCTTCHYMHEQPDTPYGGGNSKFLRRNSTGQSFCQECHQREFLTGKIVGHSLAVDSAHYRQYSENESGGPIDASSVNCLSCHDGSVCPDAGGTGMGGIVSSGIYRHGMDDGSSSSHPIGVSYAAAGARKPSEYRELSLLPAGVRLPNGNVECVSCHDLYSQNEHLLVISDRGSGLCLTCHRK